MRGSEASSGTSGPTWREVLFYVAIVLIAALGFQGSRGIWEPDEGRYVNAALEMLDSGDWLVPKLHGLVYLDKPPAIYWSIAAGIKALGHNEWGVRLGHAVALIATSWLMAAWVAPSIGRRGAAVTAAVYATTLFPVVAANTATPDGLLALWTTAAFVLYWRYRSARTPAQRFCWALLLAVAVGLGASTKGPAVLMFAAPIVLHLVWEVGPLRVLRRFEVWVATLVAVGLGLAWYLVVGSTFPAAADYFFDNQIAGRLWEETYNRNPEWWKPLRIYGVSLLAGSLPWCFIWLGVFRRQGLTKLRTTLAGDGLPRFLLLAILIPLAILMLARSRLEIYVLPVAAPITALAMLAAWNSGMSGSWRRRLMAALIAVLALKSAAAVVSNPRDSRRIASRLEEAGAQRSACVAVLDTKIHGLGLYDFDTVYWHVTSPDLYPYFERPRLLQSQAVPLAATCGTGAFFVASPGHLKVASSLLAAEGWHCDRQPSTDEFQILYCSPVERLSEASAPRKATWKTWPRPSTSVTR